MQLIANGNFVADPWLDRSADDAFDADTVARAGATNIIVSQAVATAEGARKLAGTFGGELGVRLHADADLDVLHDALEGVALIAVTFLTSGDGRGFSLARRLRRKNFTGELRASGPIICDQYAFARACGFDTVEIPEALALRQPQAQWRSAQHEFSGTYQAGYKGGVSMLEARHCASLPGAATGPERANVPRTLACTDNVQPMWWAHW
jgi:uncharacterized protein (DUF934 family)